MKIGFSTGSVARDDVRRGVEMCTHRRVNAIELSALREDELDPLLASLNGLQHTLTSFEYISFHAPSNRVRFCESELVSKLQAVAELGWPIIIHPDVVDDFSLWRTLGAAVCVENMDKRKRSGRTAAQLGQVFDRLPDATFCFDIGHARQIDPTMQEAELLVRSFRTRLRQVHMSYVNSQSGHERLNFESYLAFRCLPRWLDESIPVILETPIQPHEIDEELSAVEKIFAYGRMHRRDEEPTQEKEVRVGGRLAGGDICAR